MRLLFIADGRSPIACNWIKFWIDHGDEVHLISSFECESMPGLQSFHVVPVALSGVKKHGEQSNRSTRSLWGAKALPLRQATRHWFGPLFITGAAGRAAGIIERLNPDLIHAMRIPYEGMLACAAVHKFPLIISVWGNDFTLHARSTPLMAHLTRRTLRAACALHTDCQRDARLAVNWGYDRARPILVGPANGGIHTEIFYPPAKPCSEPVIVNPRGFRSYVRLDTFFRSIPRILDELPEALFVCPGMANEPRVKEWINRLEIGHAVKLLPSLPNFDLAPVYRSATIMVSPTIHDGTPITLLESIACGCFPVVGNLESLREWITHGRNGLLIDPASSKELAGAVIKALRDVKLRQRAASDNARIIAERAEYNRCMDQAEAFYQLVLG